MPTVLVVDDEQNIRELVELYLTNEGYRVICARDGAEALALVRTEKPNLVVLDLMLPHLDGFDVCRALRKEDDPVPVIMLTARDDEIDKVVGLELGADDYVTKPFNPRELVARVRAVLRRTDKQPEHELITLGDVTLDHATRQVRIQERPVVLRQKEFDLLAILMENADVALPRERLLELAWQYDYAGDTRTVDVHIARLREKLKNSRLQIETVWGIGYKLRAP